MSNLMNRTIDSGENSFFQILLKLIPSEVIAVFLFVQGVMPRKLWPHLVMVAVLMAITPFYLSRVVGVRSKPQLVISTLSLGVWIYAMRGGPVQFIRSPYYESWYGAVLLAVWTLIPPIFLTKSESAEAREQVEPEMPKKKAPAAGRSIRRKPSARK
jgi:hypothetical protein